MGTVREFAERVLYADSLADKLRPPPAGLTDVHRGPAQVAPSQPGRPAGLELSEVGTQVRFPGVARIEDEAERGRLLHFFANHELLATELMALVLLKFPEAPAEFRTGVLRTLKEEQMHAKLYLRRMAACGVSFGELPVNGFFWRLVAPMATPLDYVTRLSLTFEQANLDYARGYARVLAEAGDGESARILERIYQDEIGHVHYGLEWFRRWRRGESDWKSFCSLLGLPLSPRRAKGGFEFNEEGRRAAGLDEEFIAGLRACGGSRGRTPRVHWFDPGAEDELAGRGERRAMRQARRDLDLLMAVVARAEDVTVVERVPSTTHRLALQEAGIDLSELVAWADAASLGRRKLGGARPWAATPASAAVAAGWGLELAATERRLFSKVEQLRLARRLSQCGGWARLMPGDEVGELVERGGAGRWVTRDSLVKAEFSTAGRDRLRLAAGDWFDGVVPGGGRGVLEPWCEVELDLSIQYDRLDDGRLLRRGTVVLENTAGGQFRTAWVTSRLEGHRPAAERREWFREHPQLGDWAVWMEDVFEPELARWLGDYRGPLGVDAMVCRGRDGAWRYRPLVEVNPRLTMGRVAVELDRFAAKPGRSGLRIQRAGLPAPPGAVALTEAPVALAAYWLRR